MEKMNTMKIKFEDPIQFTLEKSFNDINVRYSSLQEIAQGGPEVGKLTINNKLVEGHRFGGPCIIHGKFVYAPVFVRKFFRAGFILSKIHSITLEVITLGRVYNLIYLEKIIDGEIHFFEDLNKTKHQTRPLG